MKEIIIKIDGTQNFGNEDSNKIELTTTGTIETYDDKKIITYEESELTGMQGTTTKVIVNDNGTVELSRKGTTNSQLVFEEGKKNISYYDTEAGAFSIAVFASYVETNVEEDYGELEIEYVLEVDGTPVGQNEIRLTFETKF